MFVARKRNKLSYSRRQDNVPFKKAWIGSGIVSSLNGSLKMRKGNKVRRIIVFHDNCMQAESYRSPIKD